MNHCVIVILAHDNEHRAFVLMVIGCVIPPLSVQSRNNVTLQNEARFCCCSSAGDERKSSGPKTFAGATRRSQVRTH